MPFKAKTQLPSTPFLLCLSDLVASRAAGNTNPLEITRVKHRLGVGLGWLSRVCGVGRWKEGCSCNHYRFLSCDWGVAASSSVSKTDDE